jgi:O-antigen/teichoic acid export membrane protein
VGVARYIKQLAGESMIYGVAATASRLVGVLLLPVYARAFSTEQFGVVTLLLTVGGLLGTLAVLGLDNAMARWFYDSEDRGDRQATISSSYWAKCVAGVLLAVTVVLLSPRLSQFVSGGPGYARAIALIGIGIPFTAAHQTLALWLRVQRRPVAASIYSAAALVSEIGLVILFVLTWSDGVAGLFAAKLVCAILLAAVSLAVMRGWLDVRACRRERLKAMLRFGLPMVPAAVGMWLMATADRFCLSLFRDNSEVGIYGVAALVASGVNMATSAFTSAWGPFAFSIMRAGEAHRVYAKVLDLYSLAGCAFCTAIALFSPLLLRLLTTEAYYGAASCIPLLAFAMLLNGARFIAVFGCSQAKKSVPAALSIGVGLVVACVMNVLLVPALGKEGAGLATLLGYGSCVVYLFAASQRHVAIPYRWHIGIACFVFSWVLIAADAMFVPDWGAAGFLIRVAMVLCYILFDDIFI